jgi:hypothetical protein
MNREDIIRMARKAGFADADEKGVWITDGYWDDEINRFAAFAYQEGYAKGAEAANRRHCEVLRELHKTLEIQTRINAIKSREGK